MNKANILPGDVINKYIILEELEPVGKFRRFKHQCSKCGKIQETFYNGLNKLRCCDGYESKIVGRTEKKCSKCKNIKSIDNFYKSKGSKDLHSCYCIECANLMSVYDPIKNRENSLKRIEKRREYMREYSKTHAKKEHVKLKQKEYKKIRYKLSKEFYQDDLLDILRKQNGKCNYCGGEATDKDHIIPISKGGPNTLDNIQRICHSCNCKKYTKTHEEFLNYLELEKQYI